MVNSRFTSWHTATFTCWLSSSQRPSPWDKTMAYPGGVATVSSCSVFTAEMGCGPLFRIVRGPRPGGGNGATNSAVCPGRTLYVGEGAGLACTTAGDTAGVAVAAERAPAAVIDAEIEDTAVIECDAGLCAPSEHAAPSAPHRHTANRHRPALGGHRRSPSMPLTLSP